MIRLDSRLEIREVEALHGMLLQALEQGRPITVDVSQLGAVDTAGMQLLLATRREAGRRGIPLDFAGESPALRESLERVGLTEPVLGAAS